MKTKIFTPSKTYSGVRAGVRFINGEGETDNKELIGWFKSKGYFIGARPQEAVDPDPKSAPVTGPTEDEVKALKYDALVELAKKLEIEDAAKTKKDELVAAVLEKLKTQK